MPHTGFVLGIPRQDPDPTLLQGILEPSKGEIENAADSYISTKTERGKPMPEAPLPGWEKAENPRRFMEQGTLELSFNGPIGIWQAKGVGNGEKDFPTQHAKGENTDGRILAKSPHVWSPV